MKHADDKPVNWNKGAKMNVANDDACERSRSFGNKQGCKTLEPPMQLLKIKTSSVCNLVWVITVNYKAGLSSCCWLRLVVLEFCCITWRQWQLIESNALFDRHICATYHNLLSHSFLECNQFVSFRATDFSSAVCFNDFSYCFIIFSFLMFTFLIATSTVLWATFQGPSIVLQWMSADISVYLILCSV